MKKLLLVGTALLLSLGLVGCGGDKAESKSAPSKAAKKLNIALVSKGYQHEFWRTVEMGAKAAGEEFGVDVSFIGPEKESEIGKQVAMVENAINRRVDAIGLAALDANALMPVARKAIDAGIPVITFDSDVAGDISSSFVATDNEAAGIIAGEEMAKRIGKAGKVAIIAHNPGTTTAIDREAGFRKAMKNYPDIEVLNTQFSDGDKSKALAITQDIIMANPDIKGIYGTNEGSAVGMAKGVEEKGLAGKLVAIGFDSSADEIRFVEKGVLNGMVVQNPFQMGYLTVKTSVEVLKNQSVEKRIDTGAKFINNDNINDEDSQKLLYPLGK